LYHPDADAVKPIADAGRARFVIAHAQSIRDASTYAGRAKGQGVTVDLRRIGDRTHGTGASRDANRTRRSR
jgi:hypothetical protein